MSRFVDYYQMLGVDQKATLDEIKQAYESKTLQLDEEQSILFKEAYCILTDEKQRRIFDIKYNLHQKQKQRQEQERLRKLEEERKRENAQNLIDDDLEFIFSMGRARKKQETHNQIQREQQNRKSSEDAFQQRHDEIEDVFYNLYAERVDYLPKLIAYHTAKGTLHIFAEALYQIQQFKDPMVQYKLRRNAIVASVLVAGVLFTSGGIINRTESKPKEREHYLITNGILQPDDTFTMNRLIYQLQHQQNTFSLAELSSSYEEAHTIGKR